MKNNLLALLGLSFLTVPGCISQNKIVKPYGYYQSVIPGTIPAKDIYEDGSIKEIKRAEQKNYYIYASIDSAKDITITDLWLDGIHFTAKTELVEKTPVEKLYPSQFEKIKPDTLVPATENKVLLILPGDNTVKMGLATPTLPEKYKEDEMVIGYMLNGKKNYAALNKLKRLSPEVHQ